jgi:hypothetical protein
MSDSSEHKNANAEAKAAKAKAKALRPWFKKKRFIVPIALVLLVGLSRAGAGSGSAEDQSSSNGNNSNSSENGASEEAKVLSIGDSAVDGSFTFVVKGIKCGIKKVGDEYLNKEAQGQFCRVTVTVSNTGDEAQTLFGDNQKLFDSAGREFSADTGAMIYDGKSGDSWINEINPGNSIEGGILFDVPKDADIVKIELHDSAFSSGVEVSLK